MTEDGVGDLPPAAVVRAIEASAVDGCRAWAAWDSVTVREDRGLLWLEAEVPSPIFNAVLRADLGGDVDARIAAVVATARQRRVPFAWFTSPGMEPPDLVPRLERHGFVRAGETHGMAADLATIDDAPLPHGVAIEAVTSAEALDEWCRVMTGVYGFDPLVTEAWTALHHAMGTNAECGWRHYVARLDGIAVAAASLFLGEQSASIASVATVPTARRRGIGTAVSRAPLLEARRRGYRVATLCAATMGVPVYRALGFREFCRMYPYFWGTDAAWF